MGKHNLLTVWFYSWDGPIQTFHDNLFKYLKVTTDKKVFAQVVTNAWRLFIAFSTVERKFFLAINQNVDNSASLNYTLRVVFL